MSSPLFTIPGIIEGRFLGLLLNVILVLLIIYYMREGRLPYMRRVAGLDAIEEAVGRSAEMGRPVVCSYGIAWDGFDYWTVAALAVLGYVARLCARTGTRLIVPTGGSDGSLIVRPVAVETVRTAYLLEGKEEEFDEKDLPFLSGQQYAYTGGYIGILQRARPGAVIMLGSHYSEAMNITETANAVGSLTITTGCYASNLACLACASDYILIGEEGTAAGAYLSEDPAQRASFRAQDIYKWIALAFLILGLIAINAGSDFFVRLLAT